MLICPLVFPPPTDGSWSCEKPKVLKLGVLPVKAMLAVEEHLWAASGGQVFIISTHAHCVEVGDPTDRTHRVKPRKENPARFFYLKEGFNLRSAEKC